MVSGAIGPPSCNNGATYGCYAQIAVIARRLAERLNFDPLLPFKISDVNGREAQESCLRLKASVAPRGRFSTIESLVFFL